MSLIDTTYHLVRDAYYHDPRISSKASYELGTGYLCNEWFFMWNRLRDTTFREINSIRKVGATAMLAVNAIDDLIDRTSDQDARLELFDLAANHLLDGKCSCRDECEPIFRVAMNINALALNYGSGFRDTCNTVLNPEENKLLISVSVASLWLWSRWVELRCEVALMLVNMCADEKRHKTSSLPQRI